jgi:hypothetical protein
MLGDLASSASFRVASARSVSVADDEKKKPEFLDERKIKFCTDDIPENAEDIASVERARLRGNGKIKFPEFESPKELTMFATRLQFELSCGLTGKAVDCMKRAEEFGVKPSEVCTFRKNLDLCSDLVDTIETHGLSRIDTILSFAMILDHLMAEQHSSGIASAAARTGREAMEIVVDLESKVQPMIDVVEAAKGFVGLDHLVMVALVRWVKMASISAKMKRDEEHGDVSPDN